MPKETQIRRALLSVTDKAGLVELAQALVSAGAELVASGGTREVLEKAGMKVRPVETLSGAPEAFAGRMKTLSFPICSGILYRRGDTADEKDRENLKIEPVDCVVVNYYPFEAKPSVETIDIGGPTLVRAAAKNAPDVLVLTHPNQYADVIQELKLKKKISEALANRCAVDAWVMTAHYDVAISNYFTQTEKKLRYGENPHQTAKVYVEKNPPILWQESITTQELSYNNVLDITAAYGIASDLKRIEERMGKRGTGVVIVKHNNPCGVAWVEGENEASQTEALEMAWNGDSVSAFGGVLVFTSAITEKTAAFFKDRFVEAVAAPGLTADSSALKSLMTVRKKIKAVAIERFCEEVKEVSISVPGAELKQDADLALDHQFKSVTKKELPKSKETLALFGTSIVRALKSNAVCLVRQTSKGALQLVGAGQGQPNRIEAIDWLAIPRAKRTLEASGGAIEDTVLVSDAFFPFRDSVDACAKAGIRTIVQPGGSLKDAEVIEACNELGIALAMSGKRHFKHTL